MRYSNTFLKSVGTEISKLNPIGIKICKSDYFNNKHPDFNPFYNADASYLHIFLKESSLINLSFSDIPGNFENKQQIAQSPINKFINDQKQNNKFINTNASIIDFIKEYKIQYLVVEKDATISDSICPYIQKTIEDNFSKERFVVLNPLKK